MFKALVKARFASYFSQFANGTAKGGKKANSPGRILLMVILFVYVLGVFAVMFGNFFSSMAQPFHTTGIDWLYFTFAVLLSFGLMFIGSVFTVKAQLFDATDNEMLLAMPIPPRYILISRMLVLLVMNFIFELLIMGPAAYIWIVQDMPTTTLGIVGFALTFLTLPLLSLALSALVGWLISLLTSRMTKKNVMTIVFYVIFLGAYFYFFSQLNTLIESLIANSQSIAGSMGSIAPLYWMGNCIAAPDATQLVFCLLIYIVPFAVMVWLISRTFIKLITTKKGAKKIKYVEKEMKTLSPRKALMQREFRRVGASSAYLMNCGVGVIFIVAIAVAAVIFKGDLDKLLAEGSGALPIIEVMGSLGLCLMASMCTFSAASVAMEGRSIWVIRSMPVDTKSVLEAKLKVHRIIVGIPTLLTAVVFTFVAGADPIASIGMILAPLAFVELSNEIGLIANLKHPFLNWLNETQAVKQGIAVMITMFSGFGICAAPALGFFGLQSYVPAGWYLIGVTVLFAVFIFVCMHWINTKGVEKFDELN